MTRVDHPIHQLILRTADLQKLNQAQRSLLLTLGHANEMAAFHRAAHAAAMDARPDADPITRQIARAQTLLMLRMAASKMYEIIILTERTQEYKEIIHGTCRAFEADRKEVRRIVSRHITLETLRNDFGFHYRKKIYDDIDTIYLLDKPGDETHEFVLDRKGVNCFFGISEYFLQKAFAKRMKTHPSFEEFAKKLIFELARDIMVALNKFIIAIHHLIIAMCRSVEIDLETPDRHNETSAPFTPAREARLPAFLLFDQSSGALEEQNRDERY
jgi:hypothetical protein